MAERNWGGGGDLSGLFAGLIEQFQSDVESATNRQIRKSRADQTAEDAETFDKWNNGLINDAEWMTFIEGRLSETEGGEDKEEHQQWVETHRKHRDAIADGQIESNYQEGSISIHDVVAHYKSRMDSVEKASPEHRETADRYYSFVDRRDGDYIDEQSAIIVDRIERGQGSYRDLLIFYEGMSGKVRSSSSLASQIRKQILNIRQIVDAVGVPVDTGGTSGGGGGGGRGGSGRGGGGGSGGGSGDGDIASNIAKANQLVTEMYTLGNVFVPSGEAIVQSVFDMFDIEATSTAILDGMEADSRYIEEMMNVWVDDPQDPTLRTPFGQTIENTAENRWAIYNQAIANYDMRVSLLNGLGKPGDASIVNGYRINFVDKVMEEDNSIGTRPMWAVRRETFNQSINLAESMANPEDALRLYEQSARSFAAAAKKTYTTSDNALPEFKLDEDLLEELHYAEQVASLVADADNMDPEEIQTVGSLLIDERPEDFWLTSDRIEEIIGTTEGPTGSGLAGKSAARMGYQATVDLRRGKIATVEQYVYVAKPGQSVPTLIKKSMVAEFLGVEDGDWMVHTRPFAERLNKNDDNVIVYRGLEDYKSPQAWQEKATTSGKAGKWVSLEDIEEVGRSSRAIAEKEWVRADIPELVGWRTATDSMGHTWYVDPEDGQLYITMPFHAGINGSFGPEDLVDQDGNLGFERIQGSKGLVMGVGPNVSARSMQILARRAAEAGEIDTSQYFDRDVGTNFVNYESMQIADLEGMYWNEADAANKRLQKANAYVSPFLEGPQDYRRAIAARNQERKTAAVREWFDTIQSDKITRHEGLDSKLDSSAIDLGSQQSGVVMGRKPKPMDEPAKAVHPEFRVQRRPIRAAPISINSVRRPVLPTLAPRQTPAFSPPRLAPRRPAVNPVPTRATSPIRRTTSTSPIRRVAGTTSRVM